MFFPVMIEISGKEIIIFGGGEVAYRKVKTLLDFDVSITIVAKKFSNLFSEINGNIELIKDKFDEKYINDKSIVFAATNDAYVNEEISAFCREKNVLCNVVSDSKLSSFISPAIIKRGDLVISVSTSTKYPKVSKLIKSKIETSISNFDDKHLSLLGELRTEILSLDLDDKKKNELLNELINLSVEELELRRKK